MMPQRTETEKSNFLHSFNTQHALTSDVLGNNYSTLIRDIYLTVDHSHISGKDGKFVMAGQFGRLGALEFVRI
jgi:hypothetical protein